MPRVSPSRPKKTFRRLPFLLLGLGLLLAAGAVLLAVYLLHPPQVPPVPGPDTGSVDSTTLLPSDTSDPLFGDLLLSEVSPANRTWIPDGDGEYNDWIELYNASSRTLDLKGVTLSDSSRTWSLPSLSLGVGQYLIVYASGKDRAGTELHTSFRLGQDTDRVILSHNGAVIDQILWTEPMSDNTSLARSGDQWESRRQATPGYPNTSEGERAFLESAESAGKLQIWEMMTSNDQYLPQSGKYYDWFELKNTSGQPLSLVGWKVGKKADGSDACALPERTLSAGQILTVFAPGKGESAGSLSVPLGLGAEAETLYLFTPEGKIVDAVCAADTSFRGSYGRMAGEKGFFYFALPTPKEENRDGKRDVTVLPAVSVPDGIYSDKETLEVALSGEGTIHYTLDGSEPSASSPVYVSPLTLTKTSVIRAVCISPEKVTGKILTACYFLKESVTLPVVNISILPDDMWSEESGIYATGPDASDKEPYYGANYWKDWEKKINLSVYDENGKWFSSDCGLKIFGGWGRAERKKSFQVKFRGVYGCSELVYPIFGEDFGVDTFQSLVLRSGSQDFEATTIRDIFMTSLASEGGLNVSVQAYRFCLLYINGEYWGIYSFREKVDDDYVASHYNVSPDSVSMLRYGDEPEYGSSYPYEQLIRYVKNHDMRNLEYYNYVTDRVDLDSYIDWYISAVWSGSTDLDNVRYFSSTEADGKWRWVLYDFDLAFMTHTSFAYMARNYPLNHTLMNALIRQPLFREKFLTRLGELLSGPLSEAASLARIDALCAEVDAEMTRDRTKWKLTYAGWQKWVTGLRSFIDGKTTGKPRSQEVKESAISYFNVTDEEIARYFSQ